MTRVYMHWSMEVLETHQTLNNAGHISPNNMEKLFVFETLSSYIKFIAIVSAVVGSIFFYKYRKGKARYFVVYLWLIAATEFAYKIAYYDLMDEDPRSTIIVSNLFVLFQALFCLLWYRYLVIEKSVKRLIMIMLLFFLLFFFVDALFFKSLPDYFLKSSSIFGTIFIVVAVLIYFREVLNSDFVLKLNRSVYFWFSLGLLAFNIPFLPIWLMAEYLGFDTQVYRSLVFILNVIMHACFIVGILWSKKEYNNY